MVRLVVDARAAILDRRQVFAVRHEADVALEGLEHARFERRELARLALAALSSSTAALLLALLGLALVAVAFSPAENCCWYWLL